MASLEVNSQPFQLDRKHVCEQTSRSGIVQREAFGRLTVAHSSHPGRARVAAVRSSAYSRHSLATVIRELLNHVFPPISTIVKSGDRALVKVNMGCSGM